MTGFGGALRLAFRRNRMFYLWWILGLSVVLPMTVTKYHDLVPDGENGRRTTCPTPGASRSGASVRSRPRPSA
jgi:putative exporter of polyketide antibiotics